MELIYEFDPSQRIVNARFEGLDGTESVTSVKDALCLLKIRNPAVKFAETVQSGGYNDTSDAEYERRLNTIEFISGLWRYPDAPKEAKTEYEMNVLTLLAAAIEALSVLHARYQMTKT